MIKCEEHGIIRNIGNIKYCPVCGKKTVTINLFPLLKVYVDKECGEMIKEIMERIIAMVIVGILILGAVWAIGAMKGCSDRDYATRKAEEDKMPTEWHSLWIALNHTESSGQIQVVTDFIQNHPVNTTAKLKPSDVSEITNAIDTYSDTGKVFTLLTPYLQTQTTQP